MAVRSSLSTSSVARRDIPSAGPCPRTACGAVEMLLCLAVAPSFGWSFLGWRACRRAGRRTRAPYGSSLTESS
jgi:hypothetical protein